MSAVLAPHHAGRIGGYVADLYGNDPFVWTQPFLWSHCHARSRPHNFGLGLKDPLIGGKDVVFFVSTDFESGEVVFDCVFVIGEVLSISDAETRFPNAHPARHYHFDQERCPSHKLSTLTRIADPTASFIPTPPMPLGSWIECHVSARSMPVLDYFRMKKRKNVRVVTHDAQGIYDRLVQWSKMPGHAALACLPMQTLREIQPEYPAEGAIDWGG